MGQDAGFRRADSEGQMTAVSLLISLWAIVAAGALALPPAMAPIRVPVRARPRRRQ
jgi:hypothetical protein